MVCRERQITATQYCQQVHFVLILICDTRFFVLSGISWYTRPYKIFALYAWAVFGVNKPIESINYVVDFVLCMLNIRGTVRKPYESGRSLAAECMLFYVLFCRHNLSSSKIENW